MDTIIFCHFFWRARVFHKMPIVKPAAICSSWREPTINPPIFCRIAEFRRDSLQVFSVRRVEDYAVVNSVALPLPKLDRFGHDVKTSPPIRSRDFRFLPHRRGLIVGGVGGSKIFRLELGVLLRQNAARFDGRGLIGNEGADLRCLRPRPEVGVALGGRDLGRDALDTDGPMQRL